MIYNDARRPFVERVRKSRTYWTDRETGRKRWALTSQDTGKPSHVMRLVSLEAKGKDHDWPTAAVHQANLELFAAFFPDFTQDAARLGVEIKTVEGYSYVGWGCVKTQIVASGSGKKLKTLDERHGAHLARFIDLLTCCQPHRHGPVRISSWPYQHVSDSEQKQGKDCRRFDIIKDFFPHVVERQPRQKFDGARFFEQTGAPYFDLGGFADSFGTIGPLEMRFMTPTHAVLARLMIV